MARTPMTDEQLAALDPHTRAATLRKRQQRARIKRARDVVTRQRGQDTPTALPAGSGDLAGEIYARTRAALEAAALWSSAAMHDICVTFARCSATIQTTPVELVAAHVLVGQARSAKALGLDRLPAERQRKPIHARYAGDW